MRHLLLFLFILLVASRYSSQAQNTIKGTVVSTTTGQHLARVNIVNLNLVKGTSTNENGLFEIPAKVDDTLHFSYLGYKSIKVKVTNDWLKFGDVKIEMTELALALEEVVVKQLRLTGYLEVDIEQLPIKTNYRYSISGLPSVGYEAGTNARSGVSRVLGAIFNPADFLHNIFGEKPKELRKLRKMKEDDAIRNLLASRFDREMLMVLLKVDRVDLDQLISQCNYSKDFIETANDLQILDAISECYEVYKVLNRDR